MNMQNTQLNKFAASLKKENLDAQTQNLQKEPDTLTRQKKTKKTTQETYAEHLPDGTILEALFNPAKKTTHFAIRQNEKIFEAPEFQFEQKLFLPPKANHNLLTCNFVKLPSQVQPYKDEQTLMQEIQNFIHTYVEIPADFEKIATYYVLLSWLYDNFQELAYLRVIGDYGSGKSRFLNTIGSLCYRPIFATGSTSAAALFRIINSVQGTLIFDEADLRFSNTTNETIKILNSGFSQGTPVLRSEQISKNSKCFEPVAFNVFCPKIIATRQDFSDEALESRCLTTAMEVKARADIQENLNPDFEKTALELRNKLLHFRLQKITQKIPVQPLPKMQLEPRLRQILNPLYSVVESFQAKQDILAFARKKQLAMLNLRFNSFAGELLQTFVQLLTENNREPLLQEITERYNLKFAGRYFIKAKKTGAIFEKIFQLQKKRTAQGFCVPACQQNAIQLEKLKARYGLENAAVNSVNNIKQKEQIEEVPFESIPSLS